VMKVFVNGRLLFVIVVLCSESGMQLCWIFISLLVGAAFAFRQINDVFSRTVKVFFLNYCCSLAAVKVFEVRQFWIYGKFCIGGVYMRSRLVTAPFGNEVSSFANNFARIFPLSLTLCTIKA